MDYYSEGDLLDKVVDFKYHFDYLSRQLNLMLFGL